MADKTSIGAHGRCAEPGRTINGISTMRATVVPFPFCRRRRYIARQLENVAGYRPEAAARYLDARIKERVAYLRRAGIADQIIAADIEPVRKTFDAGLARMFGRRREA